jgi:hypothetical protein
MNETGFVCKTTSNIDDFNKTVIQSQNGDLFFCDIRLMEKCFWLRNLGWDFLSWLLLFVSAYRIFVWNPLQNKE